MTITTIEDLVAVARQRAELLETDVILTGKDGVMSWFCPEDRIVPKLAQMVAALDLLDRYAGADSVWSTQGRDLYTTLSEPDGNRFSHAPVRALELGAILREWASSIEAGSATPRLIEEFGASKIAATDLMEQVRGLNGDAAVTPIAPVVLAGAALEMALRSACGELTRPVSGPSSISSYSRTLREAEILTRQDMKTCEQLAGLRNEAAHGNIETLSRASAVLMEQQVNLFLDRLSSLVANHV